MKLFLSLNSETEILSLLRKITILISTLIEYNYYNYIIIFFEEFFNLINSINNNNNKEIKNLFSLKSGNFLNDIHLNFYFSQSLPKQIEFKLDIDQERILNYLPDKLYIHSDFDKTNNIKKIIKGPFQASSKCLYFNWIDLTLSHTKPSIFFTSIFFTSTDNFIISIIFRNISCLYYDIIGKLSRYSNKIVYLEKSDSIEIL